MVVAAISFAVGAGVISGIETATGAGAGAANEKEARLRAAKDVEARILGSECGSVPGFRTGPDSCHVCGPSDYIRACNLGLADVAAIADRAESFVRLRCSLYDSV